MTRTRKVKKACSATWFADDLAVKHGDRTGCSRDARARGLCWGHYQQQRRGQPYGPLEHLDTQVVLPTPRVSKACAEKLQATATLEGVSLYAIIQRILERYTQGEIGDLTGMVSDDQVDE